jgi:putative membrane protein
MHLSGGHVHVAGRRLYGLVLLPLADAGGVPVIRYDHVVHAIGFGVATLVCAHLLRPYLAERSRSPVLLWVLVALMGMGVGALNEIIELGVMLIVPEAGVGGYYNTTLDLFFNMLGAGVASAWAVRRWFARALAGQAPE